MAAAFARDGGYGAPASVIDVDPSHPDSINIADAQFLFTADFHRAGPDLILTGRDGHREIIPGYFATEHPAALTAPSGAALSPALVALLAGSPTPNEYAQAGPSTPADSIGKVEKAVGDVTAIRNGVSVTLTVGDKVYKSDVIQTGVDSTAGIGFPDGSALNFTANTRIALTNFVYDESATSVNAALFSLVDGTFQFIAGKVAHTGGMTIETPVATMGIRGTTGFVEKHIGAVTSNQGAVTYYTFGLVNDYGVDRHGAYIVYVTNADGTRSQFTVDDIRVEYQVIPGVNGEPPTVTPVTMNESQLSYWERAFEQFFGTHFQGVSPTPHSTGSHGSSDEPFNENFFPVLPPNTNNNQPNYVAPSPSPPSPSPSPPSPPPPPNPPPTPPLLPINFIWPSGTDSWDTSSDWQGLIVPVSLIDNVEIQSGAVTYSDGYTIDSLIIDPTAELDIVSGTLTVQNGLNDAGTLIAGGDPPVVTVDGVVTIATGGKMIADRRGTITVDATTFTNDAGALVEARGRGSLISISGTTVTNDGLVEAKGRGSSISMSGDLDNEEGARIIAARGGTIDLFLDSGSINAGFIGAFTGGTVNIDILDADTSNTGVMVAGHGGTINFFDLAGGGGSGNGGNFGIIEAFAGGRITFTGDLTNHKPGKIEALGPDARVVFSDGNLDNFGLIAAKFDGAIKLESEMVTNEIGAKIVADDGTITFLGGGVTNDGLIKADHGTIVFASIAATGNKIDVINNAGGKIEATDFAKIEFIGDRATSGTDSGGGQVDNSGRIEANDYSVVTFDDIAVTNEADAVIAAKDHGTVTFLDVAGDDNGGLFNDGTIGAFGLGSTIDFYHSDITGGTLDAYGGTIFVSSNSTVNGNVAVNIGDGGVVDFAGVPNANGTAISVAFSGPAILDLGEVPNDPNHTSPITVTGFGPGDVVDLQGVSFSEAEDEISLRNGSGDVTLNVTVDSGQVIDSIGFDGSYSPSDFALVRDPTGGTEVILGEVWTGGDGNWNTAGDWISGTVPTESQTAAIDSPVRVTVNYEEAVGGLIVDDHARLDIVASGSLVVYELLDNAASITAEHGGELSVERAAVFNLRGGAIEAKDGGKADFSGGTVDNEYRAAIKADGFGSKVKFFGEDIDNLGLIAATWGGSVLLAYSSIDNAWSGTIGADGFWSHVAFYRDDVDNFGLIGAEGGGDVKFYETHVDNEFSGMIGADGFRSEVTFARSSVDNSGAIVSGHGGKVSFSESRIDNEYFGTIDADGRGSKVEFFRDQIDNSGFIGAGQAGTVSFSDSRIDNEYSGTIGADGRESQVRFVRDQIDNSGLIGSKDGGRVSIYESRIDNEFFSTIGADGWGSEVSLARDQIDNSGLIGSEHGGRLSIAESHIDNKLFGAIGADGSGSEVRLARDHVDNSGLIGSEDGGRLSIYESRIDNKFFGRIEANGRGSEVRLAHDHVYNSGLITADHGGEVSISESRIDNKFFGTIEAKGWGSEVSFARDDVNNRGLIVAAHRGTVLLDRTHVDNAHGTIESLGWNSTVDIDHSTFVGGELLADGGTIVVDRSYLSDSVNVAITGGGIFDFAGPLDTGATITFGVGGSAGAGTLELDESFVNGATTIPATIVNFGTDDVIDLTKINNDDPVLSVSFVENGTNTGGELTVTVDTGSIVVNFTLVDDEVYNPNDFALITDPWGGTDIVYGAVDAWQYGGSDSWTGANWSAGSPPAAADTVEIFASGSLVLDLGESEQVANLEFGAANVTIDITEHGSLTVTNALDDGGVLKVGTGGHFDATGPAKVEGQGKVLVSGHDASAVFSDDQVGNGGTISAANRGAIFFDGADVWNEGSGRIEATDRGKFVFADGTVDNEDQARIEAEHRGTIVFYDGTVDNTRHAKIEAEGRGSKIKLFREDVDNSGSIAATWGAALLFADSQVDNAWGGTIKADGRGSQVKFDQSSVDNSARIEAENRGAVLFDGSQLDNDRHGAIEADGRGSEVKFDYSSVDNSGRIEAEHRGAVLFDRSQLDNAWSGTIEADGWKSEVKFDRDLADNSGRIEADHGGKVSFYKTQVDNERHARIEANGWGSVVAFDRDDIDNSGRIEARHGGTVWIDRSTIDNWHGTIDAIGSDANVDLSDVVIIGGTLETMWDGLIQTVHGNSTFEDLTIASRSDVLVNDGTSLTLQDWIDNKGRIDVDGGSGATLVIDGTVHLNGSGAVMLDGSNDDIIATTGGGKLDNDSTIFGDGQIGNYGDADATSLRLINESSGTIDANVSGATLTIDTGHADFNFGTLEATSGGILFVDDAVKGTGSDTISDNGILDFQSYVSAGQTVTFADASTLALSDPADFHADVTGLTLGDTIDLTGVDSSSIESATTSSSTLVIQTSGTTLSFDIDGNSLAGAQFFAIPDGGSGTDLVLADHEFVWTHAPGGNWNTASDWTEDGGAATSAPGATDLVVIGTSGDYAVTVNSADMALALSIDNPNATLNVTAGGSLDISDAVQNAGTIDIVGQSGTSNSIIESSASFGSVANTGDITVGGTHNNQGGSLVVLGAVENSGAIVIEGHAGFGSVAFGTTAELDGTVVNTGHITVGGGGIVTGSSGSSQIAPSLTFAGTVINSNGHITVSTSLATVTLQGGTVEGGTIKNTGIIETTGFSTIDDGVTVSGGTIGVSGTLTFGDGAADTGALIGVTLSSGTIAVAAHEALTFATSNNLVASDAIYSSTVDNAGTIDVASRATLTLAGTEIDNSGGGTLSVDAGATLTVGVLKGSSGTITASGATFVGGTITNAGTIEVQGGQSTPVTSTPINVVSTATFEGSVVNTGTIVADSLGDVTFAAGATVTNDFGGTINADGGTITFDTGHTVTNDGTLEATNGGTLQIDDSMNSASTGTLEANGGTLFVAGTATISDSESVLITGGGLANFQDTFDQNATFAGFGILELAQSQSYAATIHGYSDAAVLDLTDINFSSSTTVTPNGNTQLTVTDGTDIANINIAGAGYDTTWYVLSDGHSNGSSDGTLVIDPNLAIGTGGSQDLPGASTDMVLFTNETGDTGSLILGDASGFTGEIAGFTGTSADVSDSDVIDLTGISYDPGGGFSETYDPTTGLLTVTDGTNTATLTFVDFTGTFSFASDGVLGTNIFDPSTGSAADPSVLSTTTTDGADGSLTFADSHSSDTLSASFTPDGANYLGDFSLNQATVSDGNATLSWEFDFDNQQVTLAPGQTLTQSYNVTVADAQNPAANVNLTVSVSIGGPGNDHFAFAPGIGADTITNFNPQQDTIELDHFASAQNVQELQALVTTDAHGDAVINLGHNDSITLPGVTDTQLQQVIQAGHVLLH
jgi:hypothetical protein